MRYFIIDENLASALQTYIASRPLREVFDMFNAMAKLREYIPPAEAPDKKPADSKPMKPQLVKETKTE